MSGQSLTYLFAATGAAALAIVATARSSRSPELWPFIATAATVALWSIAKSLSLATHAEPWTILSPGVSPLPLAAFTSLALRAGDLAPPRRRVLETGAVGLGLALGAFTFSGLLSDEIRAFVVSDRWNVLQLVYAALCLAVSAGSLALAALRGRGERRARAIHLILAGTIGIAGGVSELVPLEEPLRVGAAAFLVALAVASVGAVTRPLLAQTIALRELLLTFAIVAAIGAASAVMVGRDRAPVSIALGVAMTGVVAFGGYRFAAGRWRRRLEQADRLATLGRAASVLAHEVRNPLTTVKGAIDILEEELGRAGRAGEAGRYLEAARAETARVLALVDDCIAYARPSAPARERFDLGALVARTVGLAAVRFPKARLVFTPPPAPLAAWGDCGQLQRLLENLLTNACQAAAAPTVRVEARLESASASLVVEDDGPGVPVHLREKIFEPFYSTKPTGGGLGLAIAREIARGHGGDVAVGGGPGGGARFAVRWPRELGT